VDTAAAPVRPAGRRLSRAGAVAARARHPVTILMLGILAGITVQWAFTHYTPLRRSPRTFLVASGPEGDAQTIAAAISAARAGDRVELASGEYAEALELRDGVDVVAREGGAAVLVAPPNRPDWVAITARAGRSTVRGLRIAGRAGAPMHAAIVQRGGTLTVDDVTFEGDIGAGVDSAGPSELIVQSSRFARVTGVPLRVHGAAVALIRENAFIAAIGAAGAIDHQAAVAPTLQRNLFVRFDAPIVPPAAADPAGLSDNMVLPLTRAP
jgi:hypothetical protein